jgi:hypothetical protein
MEHQDHLHNTNGARYEVDDASVREIVISAIGLAVGTVLICAAVFGLFRVLRSVEVSSREPITDVSAPSTFPPGPRLQNKPWEELQQLRQKEDETLTTYGWVNKNTGTVRIPIDRAMDIIAERGFPVRSIVTPTHSAQGGTTSVAR